MATIGRIISVSVVVALLQVGCGGPSPYVGSWLGERDIEFEPGTDPALSGTARRVSLRIQPDGKFLLVDGGMPMEGRLEANRLTVQYVADRPVPPEFPQAYGLIEDQGTVKLTTPTGIIAMQRDESATSPNSSP